MLINQRKINLEVLISTMNQRDHILLEKMKISSDAIVVNQCDGNKFEEFSHEGNKIRFLSFSERGVGLSRNTSLMRSSADICLIADDDVVYKEEYEKRIMDAFYEFPDADVIVFNVVIHNIHGENIMHLKNRRVRMHNFMKYGTVRIAFRRNKILKKNIFFSLLFGGGSKYGSGEDSIFLYECLKKGLKVYTNSNVIADVYNYDSTWFKGYNEKFFLDKGALFAAIGNRFSWLLCLNFAIRRKKIFIRECNWSNALKLMLRGSKEYKNNRV